MRRIKKTIADPREDAAEALARPAHGPQERFDRRTVLVVKLFVVLAILGRPDFFPQRAHERWIAQQKQFADSDEIAFALRKRQRQQNDPLQQSAGAVVPVP